MKTECMKIQGLNCVIQFPEGYRAGQKCPTVLFLHGAGSRGTDIEIMKTNPYFTITERHQNFPFVTVAPQCSENTWFDLFETLKRLVADLPSFDFVDPDRIYLMGASMGGYAAWQLAMSMPECFAAMVPICGGGMYWNASRLVNVPIWAFHGARDSTVSVEESVKMVDAVNRKNGKAKLTVYPENNHDAWSDTYANEEVFRWLLGFVNQNGAEWTEELRGSRQYG